MNIEQANVDTLNALSKKEVCLFRGQAEPWSLVPSIYRGVGFANLIVLEALMKRLNVDHFLLKNLKFLVKAEPGYNEWADIISPRDHDLALWIYLQHNGYPTPYLDWTKNFFVALLLALFPSVDEIAKIDFDNISYFGQGKKASLYAVERCAIVKPAITSIYSERLGHAYERMIYQDGVLLSAFSSFFIEETISVGKLIRYDFGRELAFEHLCQAIRNDASTKAMLEKIVEDFRENKQDDLQVAGQLKIFISDFSDLTSSIVSSEGEITPESIKDALCSIDRVPQSTKPGFDPNNLIGIG